MSPEQVRKEPLNASSDLFSLGLVLYEAATGHRAFPGTTAAAVHAATLNEAPVPAYDVNPSVSGRLWAVIAKALEKDSARRFQSADEMRIALEQIGEDTRSGPPRIWRWSVVAALLVSIACGTWFYWRSRHVVRALMPGDTVVLAVNNRTSDPVFNDAIFTAAYYGLQQTPFIHVLSTPKLLQAKRQLELKGDTNQSTDEGRQVCLQTKSRMVIASTIGDEGDGFSIEAEGIDCKSGGVVARTSTRAVVRTDVVHQLGVALVALRRKLGEPEASLAKFNLPLEEATSVSPDALQLLMDGYRRNLSFDLTGAAANYQRAIDLDPNFAMAYSAMGAVAGNLRESALEQASHKKAYDLRLRTTEAVKFQIDEHYYDNVTGEQEKGYAVLARWVQAFPDDFIAHNNLARCLSILGQPDAALAEAREEVRIFPSPWSYGFWAADSVYANRLDEAHRALDEAGKLKFTGADLFMNAWFLAFVEKNSAVMEEQWKATNLDPQTTFFIAESKTEASGYHGRFQDYLRESTQASELAKKAGYPPDFGDTPDVLALELAEGGSTNQARRIAKSYVALIPKDSSRLRLALALARAGDAPNAEKLASQADHAAPLNTIIQAVCLPSIRAAIKLQQNDAAGAITALRPALKYDLSDPPAFPALYPAYLRGLAYLQLGNGKDAETEFQKLYDHPGIVGSEVIAALAHLQMARAQRLTGDRTAARKSYEEFLSLWQTADSDIPIYRQAKSEYAKFVSASM